MYIYFFYLASVVNQDPERTSKPQEKPLALKRLRSMDPMESGSDGSGSTTLAATVQYASAFLNNFNTYGTVSYHTVSLYPEINYYLMCYVLLNNLRLSIKSVCFVIPGSFLKHNDFGFSR